MARRLDYDRLRHALLVRLSVVGSATAPELFGYLQISQAAFSRLVASFRDRLVIVGRGRATRYAARREVSDVGGPQPLYQVNESGRTLRLGVLHPILAEGFWVESTHGDLTGGFFADLPYFLHELRPQGFLGRQIPRRHAELRLPANIELWSADHCLRYLTSYGWDTVGNWLVGDRALEAYLERVERPANAVSVGEREERYLALSEDALADAPGSSAGGEQPKFLATLVDQQGGPAKSVLVKFSPPLGDRVGRRLGDLLVVEHLAHRVLHEHGVETASSELFLTGDRMFLEVARFDRTGQGGRRGVLSLLALDSELIGAARTWAQTADQLESGGHINAAARRSIHWAQCFGRLIGNTDMHFGNLSLWTFGTRVLGVAPLYDMLPMLYAPTSGHVTNPAFEPKPVAPPEAEVWDSASHAALDLWLATSRDERVSSEFRAICCGNAGVVESWRKLALRGPWE